MPLLRRGERGVLQLKPPFICPSRFFTIKSSSAVACTTCGHGCLIPPGKYGHCGTRMNMHGTLYTGIYGLIASQSVNPMEKKPFFHYRPGAQALTIGSVGCNLDCCWCQNADISHSFPKEVEFPPFVPPEELVATAEANNVQAVSFSFNEPTLSIEYILDVMEIARLREIECNFVTNGYMSPPVRDALIAAGLGAVCINIKGGAAMVQKYCGANDGRVWDNAIAFARTGVHLELVTLVIPGLNDSPEIIREIAHRILSELGAGTPWHLTRFHPCWKSAEIGCTQETPVATLEQLQRLGIDAGLQYVYVGNVPGHPGENTYCPLCRTLVIERKLYDITPRYLTLNGRAVCPHCQEVIPIILPMSKNGPSVHR